MHRHMITAVVTFAATILPTQDNWKKDFAVAKTDFMTTGRSQYFILIAGHREIYEDGGTRLVITVLPDTKVVDGVTTRIVEERETKDGKLIEVSRNYFALDRRTKDAYYFGEDVDMYQDGKIINHEGSWLSGVNGAHYGMAMPANPVRGAKYYQEVAPGTAMDRAEILSTSETVTTPGGTFRNCIKTEETTPLEPGVKEYKWYAPGRGLIQDGDAKLLK